MFKTNPSETDDMYELNKLIDEWEKPNLKNEKPHPIERLEYLMENDNLSNLHIAEIIGSSKEDVDDILMYKKYLNNEQKSKLCSHFKLVSEAFDGDYELK